MVLFYEDGDSLSHTDNQEQGRDVLQDFREVRAGERTFPAFEPASRPPHSSGDTPQRPDPAVASSFTARHACVASVLRFDSGSGRSVRSETAWLPRSLPLLAIRRPSATIRQDRSLRRLRSRHQRPCRASAVADSSLRSRPLAFTPLRTCATRTSARTGIRD